MDLSSIDILSFLQTYGYIAAFVVMVVSGVVGGVAAGFLAGVGVFNPAYIWLLSWFVDFGSDIFYYELGAHGGRRILARAGAFFQWSTKLQKKTEWLFHTHGRKTLIIVKFTQGLGPLTQIMAGAAKMPRKYFAVVNLLGGGVKSAILVTIGMAAGSAWQVWVGRLEKIGLALAVLLFLSIVVTFVGIKLQAKIIKDLPDNGKDIQS